MLILILKTQKPISIKNIDNNKTVSHKVSFGKKCFKYVTGYRNAKNVYLYAYFFQNWVHKGKTLMKLNVYLFWMKDYELSEKYNEIWKKVKNSVKKEFDSETAQNEKYVKTKVKS